MSGGPRSHVNLGSLFGRLPLSSLPPGTAPALLCCEGAVGAEQPLNGLGNWTEGLVRVATVRVESGDGGEGETGKALDPAVGQIRGRRKGLVPDSLVD